MTETEQDELIDLYIDDSLPEALQTRVEDLLARQPDMAAEVAALQAAVARLKTAPADRPDAWFVERALDRLLREHSEAQTNPMTSSAG